MIGNAHIEGADISFEIIGEGEPVLLLAGLAGVGRGWGRQVDLFAERYRVVLPDHRGTGKSSTTQEGMSIAQHAKDMRELLDHLDIDSAHVVGSSTGGAIAQEMAIRFSDRVRSIILANSLARTDEYYDRQFWLRRELIAKAGIASAVEANSLFLFSPKFMREQPDVVTEWISVGAKAPFDPIITDLRIAMILSHDTLDRLGEIGVPTLVISGRHDACTPSHMAQELVRGISSAHHVELDTGHFGFIEEPMAFFDACTDFLHEASPT